MCAVKTGDLVPTIFVLEVFGVAFARKDTDPPPELG